MKSDLGLYDFNPYVNRPKITWPNGARLAFWVAPNIEYYELDPPANPTRQAWPRPVPDVQMYSSRDYGNRVGHWRVMEAMDLNGVRGSVSLNVALCEHHPEIIKDCADRGWEFYSHGIYNTRFVFDMDKNQERAMIKDVFDTVKKHTGQTVSGWLSPALTYNEWTMDLLAEAGVEYICDLFHDDQPQPVNVEKGRLISVPYSLEMNDIIAYNVNLIPPRQYLNQIKACFDQLYQEGAESGTVMCIPLHGYAVGHPHRIAAFEEALEYITGHDDVWVTTGREIAQWYYEHHYEQAVEHLKHVKGA